MIDDKAIFRIALRHPLAGMIGLVGAVVPHSPWLSVQASLF
ncbi:MAG: hypothetical protein ACJ8G3_24070 [Burkholderiaceae bacterium]